MANMSYCRFSNTLADLRDCHDSEGMERPETLSEGERNARRLLIKRCVQIAGDYGDEVER